MTILAILPWSTRTGVSRRGRATSLVICLAFAGALTMGTAFPVRAQSAKQAGVEVDLGALDALGPPPPGEPQNPIRLHRPPPAPKASAGSNSANRSASLPAPARPPAEPAPGSAATPLIAPSPPPPAPGKADIPPPPDLPPPPIGAKAKPTPEPQGPKRTASTEQIGPVEDRILFAADAVKLPDEAKAELNQLAKRLSADPHLYVQLVAYASTQTDASQARRTSLSRALAARSYLVDQGVDIKQVDVRPLGNKVEPGQPTDRVDLVVAER